MQRSADPATKPPLGEPASRGYLRFIILSDARTGSNMLASALHSHPEITCFRELFNWSVGFIDFHVEGYDRHDPEDRALRDRDYKRFLRERIFCQHPEHVRAVGFKMPYDHFWHFAGLDGWLAEDTELRVLHLRRRNLLRALVSKKIAKMTGRWVERQPRSSNEFTLTGALRLARHPRRAARRLRRRLFPRRAWGKPPREQVTISSEEFFTYVCRTEMVAANFERLFQGHAMMTVYYEDLVGQASETYARVQSFLGVEPRPLMAGTRHQNPEPLRELLANYDELYKAYRDTSLAGFFD